MDRKGRVQGKSNLSLVYSSAPLVRGSPSFVWEKKLKATKAALKEWIKKPNKTPTSLRKDTIQILENIQVELERKDINREDLEKEHAAQAKLFLCF